jgi:hypothetical protein
MSEERAEVEDDFEVETEDSSEEKDSGRAQVEDGDGDADEDELSQYSQNVQKRIKKLTERYRQEQRDREEAVRMAQQLLSENQQLKGKVQQLDTGYLHEYGNRLQTQEEAVKRAYKQAYETGDADAMLQAQEQLATIAMEKQRYNTAKARADQQRVAVEQQRAQPAQQVPQQVPQAPKVDPKAKGWAEKNKWFGEDKVMTTAAFTIHQTLVEEEGFDPQSDEYYNEIDRRIRAEFPHKFQQAKKSGGAQVASAGASASRNTKQGRRSVKLTHSQVAIAKKLGVPLEEYAKYVKE